MQPKLGSYTTLGGQGLAGEVRRVEVLADWLMQSNCKSKDKNEMRGHSTTAAKCAASGRDDGFWGTKS